MTPNATPNHWLLAGLCLSLLSTSARAETTPDAVKPLALRGVMQEMERQMQTIAQAIVSKNWPSVEQATSLIADHPEPPLGEKLRIFAFMGTDLPRFKGYDNRTHEAALAVGQAAKDKDGVEVAARFRILQARCNACHDEFRKPFVAHFYGTR